MTTIQIEIKDCSQCPHFEITKVSSTDGFDRGEDWHCKKVNRLIAGFVEWHDKVKVPAWCPARVEQPKKKGKKEIPY